ncbi:MAG: histidine kinase [Bacteroidota bacterium]|nr:histidine kinase [Bacteroidota bacterium]
MSELALPAQECYNVFQDSRGYIWFSTEEGLCRYNGDALKVYAANKGLPEKSCYGICEFPAGKLWFVTSQNRVLNYDEKNDSLVEAGFSNDLKKCIDKSGSIYFIQPQNDSTLWFCIQWHSFSVNLHTQKVTKLKIPLGKNYFLKADLGLLPIKDRTDDPAAIAYERKVITSYPSQISIIDQQDTSTTAIPWNNTMLPQWRCLTVKNKTGDCFIGWDNKLIRIRKNNSCEIYTVATNILSLYIGNDNDLWVGTLKGGVLYFKNSVLMNPLISLPDLSITGICEDAANGVWCSSLEKGIFYCRNKYVIDYSHIKGLDQKPQLFKVINEKLFYSSAYETVFEINNKQVKKITMKFDNGFGLSDIWLYGNNYLLASGGFVAQTDTCYNQRIFFKSESTKGQFGAKQIEMTEEGRVFMLQNGGLLELVDNVIIPDVVETPSGCNVVLSLAKGKILLGCNDGLYMYDFNDRSTTRIAGITGGVVDILKDADGQIWVATKDNGLFVIQGEHVQNITNQLHLQDTRFYDLCTDKNNTVWVASNKGVIKIPYHASTATVYDVFNGLPSNEIYSVACTNENLYCSTSTGLFRFGLNDNLYSDDPPPLYIRGARVNGKPWFPGGNMKLQHNQNSIELDCDVLSFEKNGKPVLMYQLSGNNKNDMFFSKERTIRLDNLLPGKYTLTIYPLGTTKKAGLPHTISFEIQYPYWQTYWFITICCVVFLGGLYFVITFFIRRIRKREEEKTRINNLLAESQLTALQAQMNPHFIFNAINSIQRYVLEKSKHEAYDYLAKFSRLIRMVLNNSEEKILPLIKEIETITLYVELEQLRFNNKFDFTTIIPENNEIWKSYIPSMLIQPYIENAIWHGLMNLEKEQKGKLLLEIRLEKKIMAIIIEDNGIGRKKALEYRKDSVHRPVAMKLTAQRLIMINKIQNFEGATVKVIDLHNDNGDACGTRVEINLPIHFEN